MKRVLGIVIFGVGIALAVFAAGLRFYVTPLATNIPYDLEPSTTVAEASQGIHLTAAGQVLGTLRSETYVQPQPKDTKALVESGAENAETAVIWDVYSQVIDAEGVALQQSDETVTIDRKTGVSSDCGDQDDTTSGHAYKLPFGAEQKSYLYWDGTAEQCHSIDFVGVEQVSGLEAYKYEGSIPATVIDHPQLELLRAAYGGPQRQGEVYYEVSRTIYVEPTTGQFLNVQQSVDVQFVRAGSAEVTLLSGDFEYTEDTKAKAADSISTNKNLLQLVSFWLPIGGGAGGLLLIIIGVVLFATAPKKSTTDAPAPAETTAAA